MSKPKRKIKISANLILNIIVGIMTIYFIIYFCISDNGLIDLLSKPDSFNIFWLITGLLVYDFNLVIDAFVTMCYIRTQFPKFRFIDSFKVALVGIFFSAVTPSSTGGQPMQLYLLSKMKVGVGFGSSCMTQKFIVYQIMTACFSIFSIIFRFEYLKGGFTNVWSTLFVVAALLFQISVTAVFLIISFSTRITGKLLNFVNFILHKMKFVKNPDKKVEKVKSEIELFHAGNKELLKNKKLMITTYVLVFFQVLCIMSAPYFVYISFGMPQVAVANGQAPASFFDFVCIQSFVIFTSNFVPLPGASGGAELAFTMYFTPFFVIGAVDKIKPAILLWRFISYYGTLIISAPFSYLTKGKKEDDEQAKSLEEQKVNS